MPHAKPSAYERALKLLRARERTEHELRASLAARDYPQAEVDAAVTRLIELGYLDDRRVAELRARRALSEHQSRAAAAARLAKAGVGEALSQAALDAGQSAVGHSDEAAAKALLAKRKLTGLKAARMLAARGF